MKRRRIDDLAALAKRAGLGEVVAAVMPPRQPEPRMGGLYRDANEEYYRPEAEQAYREMHPEDDVRLVTAAMREAGRQAKAGADVELSIVVEYET